MFTKLTKVSRTYQISFGNVHDITEKIKQIPLKKVHNRKQFYRLQRRIFRFRFQLKFATETALVRDKYAVEYTHMTYEQI